MSRHDRKEEEENRNEFIMIRLCRVEGQQKERVDRRGGLLESNRE